MSWKIFLVLYLIVHLVQGQNECTTPEGKPKCVCKTSTGQLIDLTTVAFDNNTARFKNIMDSKGFSYDYNPCYGFTDSTGSNVAVSQIDGSTVTLVSDISTEKMYVDSSGMYQLQYSGGSDNRKSVVYLHCDYGSDPTITTDGDEETMLTYIFHLYTNEVCFGNGGVSSGYIGLILILLAITALVVYFIVGAVIHRFYFDKHGTNLIVHKRFWFSLPFLVKDGVLFVITPIVRLKNKNYQPIAGVSKA